MVRKDKAYKLEVSFMLSVVAGSTVKLHEQFCPFGTENVKHEARMFGIGQPFCRMGHCYELHGDVAFDFDFPVVFAPLLSLHTAILLYKQGSYGEAIELLEPAFAELEVLHDGWVQCEGWMLNWRRCIVGGC
eukprot:1152168-Pelagomonas_calceolata.AAC.6